MPFYGDHPINSARLHRLLPRDKNELLNAINIDIKTTDDNFLNVVAHRSTL